MCTRFNYRHMDVIRMQLHPESHDNRTTAMSPFSRTVTAAIHSQADSCTGMGKTEISQDSAGESSRDGSRCRWTPVGWKEMLQSPAGMEMELVWYSKTSPHTAKSQPIWIKFCKYLLLYGIHLWADLDRDRRMGGSRPNQNDCFCNTCNAP